MRMDLPQCSFKDCRKCFDGNCTGRNREGCEYLLLVTDRDKWHRDAITATAKLGEIRIWLAENGLDMDEVLDKVSGKVN